MRFSFLSFKKERKETKERKFFAKLRFAPTVKKAPLLEGGWHGEAVAGGVSMKKGCVKRYFTPSATACGGASSLKAGADGRAFFDKLRTTSFCLLRCIEIFE